MNPTFVLARDHLQRAASILQGADQRSRQLRNIIERTIGLMDQHPAAPPVRPGNVVEISDYHHLRG